MHRVWVAALNSWCAGFNYRCGGFSCWRTGESKTGWGLWQATAFRKGWTMKVIHQFPSVSIAMEYPPSWDRQPQSSEHDVFSNSMRLVKANMNVNIVNKISSVPVRANVVVPREYYACDWFMASVRVRFCCFSGCVGRERIVWDWGTWTELFGSGSGLGSGSVCFGLSWSRKKYRVCMRRMSVNMNAACFPRTRTIVCICLVKVKLNVNGNCSVRVRVRVGFVFGEEKMCVMGERERELFGSGSGSICFRLRVGREMSNH